MIQRKTPAVLAATIASKANRDHRGGGMVRDAHRPAHAKAGFPGAGVFEVNAKAAEERAREFHLPRVFRSMAEAASVTGAIFDVATPPGEHQSALAQPPDGATVVVQKPMGRNLAEAQRIVGLCRRKQMKAAVNFQLRFSPSMLAVRDAIRRGGWAKSWMSRCG